MKILIADDERATREGLRAAILRFFPEAEILPLASNGIEALDIAYQMPPDILISDIRMPGTDGLEMLETLYEKTFDTEFVIVSAYDNFEYAKRAMKMGVRHYILKPCKDQEIQNVIKQALRDLGERRSLRLYIERMHVDTTETGLSGQLYTKNELVNKTLAFIQSNLDSTDLTINSLARNILFVRPDYIGKIFKREVGVKLSDYIRNKRIEHAKELLRNGNDRIYEISEKCGFGDNVQHFCYLFKFLTGYTPSQYRGNVSEQETRLGT